MKEKFVIVELDFPVQLADRLLDKVTLRRPTMKDLRTHPIKGQEDVAGEMRHFGALTGLKLDELDMLDIADYQKLQEAYISFRTPTGSGGYQDGDAESGPADPLGA